MHISNFSQTVSCRWKGAWGQRDIQLAKPIRSARPLRFNRKAIALRVAISINSPSGWIMVLPESVTIVGMPPDNSSIFCENLFRAHRYPVMAVFAFNGVERVTPATTIIAPAVRTKIVSCPINAPSPLSSGKNLK